MKWHEQEISLMNDAELLQSKSDLQQLLVDRENKLNSPKAKEKFKRFPPTINPAFIELQNQIDEEIKKRNLTI